MEMIAYLKSQMHRMNLDQRHLVNRIAALPAGASIQKREEERLTQLYLWLHMDGSSIEHRRFRAA